MALTCVATRTLLLPAAKGGLGYPQQQVHQLVALLREAGAQQAHHPGPGVHRREHVLGRVPTSGHALQAGKGLPRASSAIACRAHGVSTATWDQH